MYNCLNKIYYRFYHHFREFLLASSSLNFSCLIRYRQPKFLGYTTFIHWFGASLQFLLDLFASEFGWRKIAIFGGILNSLSVLLSAFAPNPEFLMFSFSILGGIGAAIGYASVLVVSQYFEKHRGLALGITTIGGCVSNFLGPILANYMLEHYGYMGASLIFGAILLNQCVGGALYQPIEWHLKNKEIEIETEDDVNEKLLTNCKMTDKLNGVQEKSLSVTRRASVISVNSTSISNSLVNISTPPSLLEADENEEPAAKNNHSALLSILKSTYNSLKLLKYMRVQLISWGYCGLLLGYVNFRMFVPFVIINAGYSLETAAWCSSLASIGNVVGRIVMTVLSDRKFFNVRYGFMFGLFLIGTSII
ncbi:Monocarboxylate transporter 9, partial [Armadillidium vulgare]